MRRVLLLLGVAVAIGAGPPAVAGTHDFPSSTSTIVGSVGFIDSYQVGYSWSVARGDSVTESFADPLPLVDEAEFALDVPYNSLTGMAVEWDFLINGTVIGSASVAPGFTGPFSEGFVFAPIAPVGGSYEVRMEVTNEIPGGWGSHTLAYAGSYQHSVTLIPEPASLSLLTLGLLVAGRRR